MLHLLNDLKTKRAHFVNCHRRDQQALELGQKEGTVQARTPTRHGQARCQVEGTGVVIDRVGRLSFVVELKPGGRQHAHRSQLKPYVDDLYSGTPVPLYHFTGKGDELEAAPDEWLVKEVLGHRLNPARVLEFKVGWEGFEGDSTWEPWYHFFPGYNKLVRAYCKHQGVPMNIATLEA